MQVKANNGTGSGAHLMAQENVVFTTGNLYDAMSITLQHTGPTALRPIRRTKQ